MRMKTHKTIDIATFKADCLVFRKGIALFFFHCVSPAINIGYWRHPWCNV